MKIIDAICFFNEHDLLEIRLEELYDVVDRFIICESTVTHSNKPKPLYFSANRERYKKYLDKIQVVIYDNTSKTDSWEIENEQRRRIIEKLNDLDDDDIVMISDADEIPKKQIVMQLKNKAYEEFPVTLTYDTFCGSILNQYETPENHKYNTCTVCLKYGIIRENNDLQHYTKNRMHFNQILHSGWHFTSMGGPEKMVKKLESFAHVELNHDVFKNKQLLRERIDNCNDIFDRPGYKLTRKTLQDDYPLSLVNNKEKYKNLIYGLDGEPDKNPINNKEYYLLDHLLYSIKNADYQSSKLDEGYINQNIKGNTSSKMRHLMNNLLSLYHCSYLQIGKNDDANFSAGSYKNNLKTFKILQNQNEPVDGKYNICFVENLQNVKLDNILKNLEDVFILTINDYNKNRDFVKNQDLNVIYDKILPSLKENDTENYWNGLYVALLKND